MDRHHHGVTGGEQHHRVDEAQYPVELVVRGDEGLPVQRLHDGEADEQAAEKQNLGDQEQPHADLARVGLLLRCGEVMLEELAVRCRRGAHASTSADVGSGEE